MRKLALALLALPGLTLSLSACEACGTAFEGDVEGVLQIPMGADDDCQLDEDAVVDDYGDAITTGDFGVVTYNYVFDDKGTADVTDDTCTFVVKSWEGNLADTAEFADDVNASIEEAGLDPDMVSVTFESVEIAEASLRVIQGDGAEFDLNKVGPYDVTLNGHGPDGDLPEVIVIVYGGEGNPLDPDVTLTDDHEGLAGAVEAAYLDATTLTADGHASVQVGFDDLSALTAAGTADAQIEIAYRLHVNALGSLAFGQ